MTATDKLKAAFGDALRTSEFRDNKRVTVPAEKVFDALKLLKDSGFDFLSDVAGIDYLGYPDATDRFAVVYALINMTSGERLFVKTFVNDPDPEVPSVVSLWKGADWMEREVFDMFGIRFPGHPDLRRILMPDAFEDFPLRKDYPLRGHGERHNLPVLTRAES
jgi:NADH-quinone oxidoreductase subunit C